MFSVRMDYCGPKGIPLSVFLRWPEADQEAALAWQADQGRRCGQCGTHLDDWKEAVGGSRRAWHAENYTCPGCAEIERHRELPEVQDAGRGVHVRLAAGPAVECPRCQGR